MSSSYPKQKAGILWSGYPWWVNFSSFSSLQPLSPDFAPLHEFHFVTLIPQFLLLQCGHFALFPVLPGLNNGKGYKGGGYLGEIVVEGFESVSLICFSHHALSACFPEVQLQGRKSQFSPSAR